MIHPGTGLTERHKRLAEQPDDEKAQNRLRRAYRTLGRVHEYAHRFSAALQAYDQGLVLGPYRKLQDPFDFDGPIYSLIYADTLIGRAVCLDAFGQPMRPTRHLRRVTWLTVSVRANLQRMGSPNAP